MHDHPSQPFNVFDAVRRGGDVLGESEPGSISCGLQRLQFEDTDDLAAQLGSTNLELTRLGGGGGMTWFASGSISDLSFQAITATGHHHVRGSLPAGTVAMQFDLGSSGARRVGGRALAGNDVVAGLGGAEFDFLSAEGHKGMTLSLPEALVIDALRHREPGAEVLARRASLVVMKHCGSWAARARRVAAAFLTADTATGVQPGRQHARAEIGDTLIKLLLVPWRRSSAATFRSCRYQRLPIVRRVTEFMRANLGEPQMMHDLCQAARASERAVEYAFRDVCGIAPKQYLKTLRLNQVRRELKALPADAATVTTIAHQYGFWHLGHFTEAYRQLFGETPRQTRGRRVPRRA